MRFPVLTRRCFLPALLVLLVLALTACATQSGSNAHDPLPSWNAGPAKSRIIDFVARVTDHRNPDHVPEAERIATFDNDGTLWAEQPMYFQLLFVLDRVRALAPNTRIGRNGSRSRRCWRTICTPSARPAPKDSWNWSQPPMPA